MRALLSVASVASNPATHPTGPWRAPGAAASACGPTYGVRGSLTPVAGTAATGSFLAGIGGGDQPSRAGGPRTRGQSSAARACGAGGEHGGRARAALAGREPHPFRVSLTERLGGLAHLGARLAGLLPLGLARLLGFLLRLARIFLAAPIAAVHSRASRHRIPLGGSSRRSVGATALSPFMITGGPAPPANIPGFGPCLHARPDDPGSEFLFAPAGELAPRALSRRHRHDLLEDLSPHLGQRRALEDDSAIDVHVLLHVAVHERVGGELDGGHGLAAEDGAAAR